MPTRPIGSTMPPPVGGKNGVTSSTPPSGAPQPVAPVTPPSIPLPPPCSRASPGAASLSTTGSRLAAIFSPGNRKSRPGSPHGATAAGSPFPNVPPHDLIDMKAATLIRKLAAQFEHLLPWLQDFALL